MFKGVPSWNPAFSKEIPARIPGFKRNSKLESFLIKCSFILKGILIDRFLHLTAGVFFRNPGSLPEVLAGPHLTLGLPEAMLEMIILRAKFLKELMPYRFPGILAPHVVYS